MKISVLSEYPIRATALRHRYGPFLLLLLFLAGTSTVHAQDTAADCSSALTEAETAYFNGAFDQTLALLQPCIEQQSYSSDQAQRAFTLLGRTHFVLGNTDDARSAIESLYLLNPQYTPPSQLPPNFVSFLSSVRNDMVREGKFRDETVITPTPIAQVEEPPVQNDAQRQKRRKRIALFGGGAALAVAGVTTAILLGGSSNPTNPPSSEWPLPPGRP